MGEPNVRMAQFLASWQARSGQVAEAKATIMALAEGSSDLSMAIPGLLANIDAPQVTDARQGIAEAYVGMAGAPAAGRQDQPAGDGAPTGVAHGAAG